MKHLAISIPIVSGKTAEWKMFMDELHGKWWGDFKESRKRLGMKERTFFQSTPHGDMVIITLEGENPAESFAKFGQGKDEFTMWFLDKVKTVHGVDLSQPMPGKLPELVTES